VIAKVTLVKRTSVREHELYYCIEARRCVSGRFSCMSLTSASKRKHDADAQISLGSSTLIALLYSSKTSRMPIWQIEIDLGPQCSAAAWEGHSTIPSAMPFFLRVSTGAARISVSFFSWHARVCALMMVEQGRSTYHCRTPCCHTGEIRGVKIRRVHHVGVIHGWACQEAKEPRTKWRGGLDDCICQEAECAGRRHV